MIEKNDTLVIRQLTTHYKFFSITCTLWTTYSELENLRQLDLIVR